MYQVKITVRHDGHKKAKSTFKLSMEKFENAHEAASFIKKVVAEQEKACWKAWGMASTKLYRTGNAITAHYEPAITILNGFTQTFEIVRV